MSVTVNTYECPVCLENNDITSEIELNELIDCITCGSELEVVNLSPFEIIESECDGEDWGQ